MSEGYNNQKITKFTDMIVWQKAHNLVLCIYKMTKNFPEDEKFGLTSQIRRCAVSITSNIAEGFSRKSYKEKSQSYSLSLGSLTELQNQLLIARDVEYISRADFDRVAEKSIIVHKLLNGIILKSKNIHNS